MEKAKKVLVKIRPVRLAEEELEDIVKDIESNPSLGWRETFVILFSKRVFVRCVHLCVCVCVCVHVCMCVYRICGHVNCMFIHAPITE